MGLDHRELEVLVPLDDDTGGRPPARPWAGGPGPHRARLPRWLVVAMVAVVVGAGIAVPVRDGLAQRELPWLQRQWDLSQADNIVRASVEGQLIDYEAVTAKAQVYAPLAVLYRENRQRLTVIVARLQRAILVDHGLSMLRRAVVAALGRQAALLAAVAAWYTRPTGTGPPPDATARTAIDTNGVERLLGLEEAHWHEQPAPSLPAASRYGAAESALGRLSRWLDQRSGAVLVGEMGEQLVRLDIDASRIVLTAVPIGAVNPTPRTGYLAYASAGQVWAAAPDGSGPTRALAPGDWLFPAVDSEAVWVGSYRNSAVSEIDGTGRILVGAAHPPDPAVAATSAGLVLEGQDPPSLEVWNPAAGRVGCRLAATVAASVLAVRGNLVAWTSDDGLLHLTDVTTCRDQFHRSTDVTQLVGPLDAAAFSPDGSMLAVSYALAGPHGDTYPLELLDVASGRVTDVPAAPEGPSSQDSAVGAIVWTPDGSRLFWLYTGQLPGALIFLDTWRLGDARAQVLRAVNFDVGPPMYAVP